MLKLISRLSSRSLLKRSTVISVEITQKSHLSDKRPAALRSRKAKSSTKEVQYFVDAKRVRAIGGKGGDGCISFLQLWANDKAGPDGGDGGNGGHVIFQASIGVRDLQNVGSVVTGESGENGRNKDCHGECAKHTIVPVPLGTIFRDLSGQIVGDLGREGLMFIGARGGAGGKGNHFFISDTIQAPKVCQYGAEGENISYQVEVQSIAHIGLLGMPNAGKSTLLRAITRARPKVAPYPFTTLKPHLGIVHYDDYVQIAIADLPGLIPGSHRNRGLGIQFLKHVERCNTLLFILDVSVVEPWQHFEQLQFELSQFNPDLLKRTQIIVANKIDLPESEENLKLLRQRVKVPILEISAKNGTNLNTLLSKIREIYDAAQEEAENQASGE
ncbi:mitochondrial ribosome-associated GTPase 2 [Phlebotomus argentipes]|uniref:mitochondrial ribosome-associated GTPase 2 n=1 Tax=Phlebotomus argentipes TaxID=94469 RepID=UPI00289337D0|nr:mitochondrial ribosome-associated GTPase 2 [Phlebotomus argentipes]